MASSAEAEEAGNSRYQSEHMGAIFVEGMSFSGYERDYLGLQRDDGTYLNVSGVSGVDSISDGRGAAFADFDNDGDLDIFLVTLQDDAHHLYRNNVGQDRGFLRVELTGTDSGTDAFGAVVRVKSSAGILTKVKAGGSGFLAQHDPRLLFGLGDDPAAEWVEVTWPAGGVQRFGPVPAGSSIRVIEGRPDHETVEENRFSLPDPVGPRRAMLAKLELRPGEPIDGFAVSDVPAAPGGEARPITELLRPGRRTLVNLWATWCIPCRREMPELQRLRQPLAEAGIDLVGVSIDTGEDAAITRFLEERGITYPVVRADPGEIADLYRDGEVFVPLTLLLDERGRVLEVLGAWSRETAERLEALAAGG